MTTKVIPIVSATKYISGSEHPIVPVSYLPPRRNTSQHAASYPYYLSNMDPTHAIVDSLILPYAAFHKEKRSPSTNGTANGEHAGGVQRSDSISNPKNGGDDCLCPSWDIDGGETDRGFFCTVPTFARHKPPLRVTATMAWDQTRYSPELSGTLELDAFFRAGKRRIHDLPLTKHIRKALTYWSCQRADFESEYNSLPFGSAIVVDSLHEDFKEMKIRLLPVRKPFQRLKFASVCLVRMGSKVSLEVKGLREVP